MWWIRWGPYKKGELRKTFDMLRVLPRVLLEGRRVERARRLKSGGRWVEAFRECHAALTYLVQVAPISAQAATFVIFKTVLLDELAVLVGQPQAARESLVAARALCEELVEAVPGVQGQLGGYIDWYTARLGELDSMEGLSRC